MLHLLQSILQLKPLWLLVSNRGLRAFVLIVPLGWQVVEKPADDAIGNPHTRGVTAEGAAQIVGGGSEFHRQLLAQSLHDRLAVLVVSLCRPLTARRVDPTRPRIVFSQPLLKPVLDELEGDWT